MPHEPTFKIKTTYDAPTCGGGGISITSCLKASRKWVNRQVIKKFLDYPPLCSVVDIQRDMFLDHSIFLPY